MGKSSLEKWSSRLREMGLCNSLFSDGETPFAHGDTSLHLLCRTGHREPHTLGDDVAGEPDPRRGAYTAPASWNTERTVSAMIAKSKRIVQLLM